MKTLLALVAWCLLLVLCWQGPSTRRPRFLLNGTAWEVKGVAGQAILGGREIGSDTGYGWSEGKDAPQYLLHYYEPLRAFFKRAAGSGQAIVMAIM